MIGVAMVLRLLSRSGKNLMAFCEEDGATEAIQKAPRLHQEAKEGGGRA
jgi:hypothetical protein